VFSDSIYFDRETVKEKWGVYPENFIDLLSIIGDSSDIVPWL
jgi:5'-3' exonuclease